MKCLKILIKKCESPCRFSDLLWFLRCLFSRLPWVEKRDHERTVKSHSALALFSSFFPWAKPLMYANLTLTWHLISKLGSYFWKNVSCCSFCYFYWDLKILSLQKCFFLPFIISNTIRQDSCDFGSLSQN